MFDPETCGYFFFALQTARLSSPSSALTTVFPFPAAEMHNYISEAVRWMMNGGTARNNFKPLLWAGLRDWDSSSAWTRGVVSLELETVARALS